MQLVRSILKLIVSNIGSSIVSLAGLVYFGNILGSSGLGKYFLFQTLLFVLSIVSDFGLRAAAEKRISERSSDREHLGALLVLKSILVVVATFSIFLLENSIDSYIGKNISLFLIPALILRESALICKNILMAELAVEETAVLRVLNKTTWFGVGFVLVEVGVVGTTALVYGLISGFAVMFVVGFYRVSTVPAPPSVSHYRSLVKYAKYSGVLYGSSQLYNWADVFVLGFFVSSGFVGAYEVAWRVTKSVSLLVKPISQAIFPQMSVWDGRDDMESISSLAIDALGPPLMLVVPATFGTLLLSEEILGIVFGAEFTIAAGALVFLMLERVPHSVYSVVSQTLQSIDRPDLVVRALIPTILVNGVLNVILVPSFGIEGAAVATLLSFSLNMVLSVRYLGSRVDFQFPWPDLSLATISSAGMAVGLFPVVSFVQVNSVVQLVALVITGVVLYVGLLTLFPRFRNKYVPPLVGRLPAFGN